MRRCVSIGCRCPVFARAEGPFESNCRPEGLCFFCDDNWAAEMPSGFVNVHELKQSRQALQAARRGNVGSRRACQGGGGVVCWSWSVHGRALETGAQAQFAQPGSEPSHDDEGASSLALFLAAASA